MAPDAGCQSGAAGHLQRLLFVADTQLRDDASRRQQLDTFIARAFSPLGYRGASRWGRSSRYVVAAITRLREPCERLRNSGPAHGQVHLHHRLAHGQVRHLVPSRRLRPNVRRAVHHFRAGVITDVAIPSSGAAMRDCAHPRLASGPPGRGNRATGACAAQPSASRSAAMSKAA